MQSSLSETTTRVATTASTSPEDKGPVAATMAEETMSHIPLCDKYNMANEPIFDAFLKIIFNRDNNRLFGDTCYPQISSKSQGERRFGWRPTPTLFVNFEKFA